MSTGTTLISRSLRMLGVLASGVTPNTNELADGKEAFNALLESLRNDRMLVYSMVDNTLTMTPADNSYTIGTGGDLNMTRPVKFEDAYMRYSNVDTPVKLLTLQEWDAIPDKTVTSPLVSVAYYNPTMTSSQGTLQVYPTPSAANVLHLVTWTVLASLANVGDTVLLPPGYDRMIVSNLAIELAPEYGVTVSQEVAKIARESMAQVKRINHRPILMQPMFKTTSANILTGP